MKKPVIGTHARAQTAFKKRIVRGKVKSEDHRFFTVSGVGRNEERVVLDFGHPVKYRVVKLSIRGLPLADGRGKKITWINNFGVKGASGRYAKRVRYTLFLRGRPGKTFVYYGAGGLRRDKKPRPHGTKHMPRGWVKVSFSSGDPAAGWG
jgi:hypothetical protein